MKARGYWSEVFCYILCFILSCSLNSLCFLWDKFLSLPFCLSLESWLLSFMLQVFSNLQWATKSWYKLQDWSRDHWLELSSAGLGREAPEAKLGLCSPILIPAGIACTLGLHTSWPIPSLTGHIPLCPGQTVLAALCMDQGGAEECWPCCT